VAMTGLATTIYSGEHHPILAISERSLLNDLGTIADIHGSYPTTEGNVAGLVLRGATEEGSRWSVVTPNR